MRFVALKCDHCGAPLDVPADREQFTCGYCGTGLHLSHPSPKETPQGKPPDEQTRQILAELDQLDREWEAYRAQYLNRSETGEYVIPEEDACRMGAWVAGILGVLGAILLLSAGWLMAFVVVVLTVGVVLVLLRQAKVGRVYLRSLDNYRNARMAIVRRLPRESLESA